MEDIIIPSGWDAKIEGNKVVFAKKESEDEKIRKDLINLIEWLKANPNFCSQYYKDRYGEMLAYLEKQKEQEPKMIQWTGKNLKEVIDFTGKSPKFNEWFKSWDDFENYVHSHDDILKLFCGDGSHYEVPIGTWIVKTPDGYNTPSRFKFIQKSAERSKEEIVNWAYDNFRVSSFDMTKIVTNFSSMDELERSLREKLESLLPQQKYEWSEEDEHYFQNLIMAVNSTFNDGNTKNWLQNRFKSLLERFNPQPGSLKEDFVKFGNLEYERDRQDGIQSAERTCWKPSEQEKGALSTAIYVLTEERSFPKAAAQLQNILNAFEGKGSRKDWKPSKEQLAALEHSYRACYRDDICSLDDGYQLRELYNKLIEIQQNDE